MDELKLSICPCCDQVITRHMRDASKRHLNTIYFLYGYTFSDLKEKTKVRTLVEARQHFWFLLCVEDGWSTPRIARKTGHDHTSVIYGIRVFAHARLGTPPRAKITEIVRAYWLAVGDTEEVANAKAEARKNGR